MVRSDDARAALTVQPFLAEHKIFFVAFVDYSQKSQLLPHARWDTHLRQRLYHLLFFLKMTGSEKSKPSSAIRGGGGGTGLARSTIAMAA
jgi:hypothetical protein